MPNTPEAGQRQLPEPIKSIWEALNSLPIAIAVMLLLAILSALGTMIPQQHLAQPEPGMTMDQMYAERFGPLTHNDVRLGPKLVLKIPTSKHALIDTLGFKRVYYTPYFFILLVWLSVSAIVCNITRFKRTWKLWKQPKVPHGAGFFRADQRAIVTGPAAADKFEQVKADLKQQGFRVFVQDGKGGKCLYADRGFIKRWALVLLHFSILVLLFGGIYGKIYGIEDYVRMADGERKTLVLDLHKGKISLVKPLIDRVEPISFDLAQDNFHIDYDKKILLPAVLQQMVDDKQIPEEVVPYYQYFVKDFVSDFTMSRNGKTLTKEVKVNHPIKLDKLVMYQSGYQQIGYVEVEYKGETKEYSCPPEQWIGVAPAGLVSAMSAVQAGQPVAEVAFRIQPVKAGDLYVRGENTGYMGPLTIAHLFNTATMQDLGQMLLTPENPIETSLLGEPLTIRMSKRVDNYSDFSYKRDPGIPILYLGWIAMIVGIALTLYLTFTQVWLRFEDGKTYALVAGGNSQAADKMYVKWNDMLNGS